MMIEEPGAARSTKVHIEPDLARGFVLVRVEGVLEMPEGQRVQAEVAAQYPGLHRLWDLRRSRLTNLTGPEIDAGIEAIAARTPPAGAESVRVAALVADDFDFALSRMFEGMASRRLPMRYGVFRDEAEAIEWLLGVPHLGERST